jgi:hypothetical protein
VTEQDTTTALTACMGLASYVWRLLSEQKAWTVERWLYLVTAWAVFSWNARRVIFGGT